MSLLSSPVQVVAESFGTDWLDQFGRARKGELKKDADGYYKGILVGALGTYNSSGEFYECDQEIIDAVMQYSIMAEKFNKKVLYSEWGHPRRYVKEKDGTVRILTDEEYCMQYFTLSDRGQCGHVGGVRIVKSTSPDKYGNYPHLIYFDIKPCGQFGPQLEERLLNPKENGCFSMRWLAHKEEKNGVIHKRVFQCITADAVGEGGIELCVKENHLSFEEARPSVVLTEDMLNSVRGELSKTKESPESANALELIDDVLKTTDNKKQWMPGSFLL